MPLNKPKHGASLCISQQFHPKSLFPGFVAGKDLNKSLALAGGVCLLLSWLGEQAGIKGLHKDLPTSQGRSREGLNPWNALLPRKQSQAAAEVPNKVHVL